MLKKKDFEQTSEGKIMRYMTENKVYCTNCNNGYGVVFINKKIDRKLCIYCGHWIYRDPQTRLKYEMKERGILK